MTSMLQTNLETLSDRLNGLETMIDRHARPKFVWTWPNCQITGFTTLEDYDGVGKWWRRTRLTGFSEGGK